MLLAESSAATPCELFIDHPEGVTLELCERVTHALPELREEYALRSPRPGPSVRSPSRSTSGASSAVARACARATRTTATRSFTGELVGASETEVTMAADTGVVAIPYADISRSNLVESEEQEPMSREILEAMTALAREKGISPEKLMAALEDALLSAYKKQPGAAQVRARRDRPRDRRLPSSSS